MIDLNGYVYQCPSCEGFASKPLTECHVGNCEGGEFIKVPARKATTKRVRTIIVTETYISADLMDSGWPPAHLEYRATVNGENPIEVKSNEGLIEFGCSKSRYAKVTRTALQMCHKLFGIFAFNNADQEDLLVSAIRKEDLNKIQPDSFHLSTGAINESLDKKL